MAQTKNLRWLICGPAISLLFLLLPNRVLAHGGDERTRIMIGEYLLTPVFAKPPKTGDNFVYMQIVNGTGKPVSGAQVEISAKPVENTNPHQENVANGADMMNTMADMQGMHAMHGMGSSPTTAPIHDMSSMSGMDTATTQAPFNELPPSSGDYFGVITFSAPGHWKLNTHFTINGQMFNTDFPVDVGDPSSSFAITALAAFIGLNALIIWIASFTKRNPVSV